MRHMPNGPPSNGQGARLGVALLVRGVSAHVLSSFVCYHRYIGFERIYLFLDAPDEPLLQQPPGVDGLSRIDGVTITCARAQSAARLFPPGALTCPHTSAFVRIVSTSAQHVCWSDSPSSAVMLLSGGTGFQAA